MNQTTEKKATVRANEQSTEEKLTFKGTQKEEVKETQIPQVDEEVVIPNTQKPHENSQIFFKKWSIPQKQNKKLT